MTERVLVVDDELRWRTRFQAILSADGIEVDVAEGTAQAADMLREREYGLVLLDVVFGPAGDTLDCQLFLDALAHERPSLPIVATTGKPLEPPEVARICRYRVVDFLYKPRIDVAELRQHVRAILARGQSETGPPGAETRRFRYDAFVSYSRHDGDWVTRTLLPELESAALRVCIDQRDFRPGAPIIVEIERGVQESRCTLLVLTPDYVASDWTMLEGVLVQTLDPSARLRRTLPLLLRPCDLPLRIRALTYVDFTRDTHSVTEFARLIAAIQCLR